jgi:hypothetical protein
MHSFIHIISKNSPHFLDSEFPLPCSQQHDISPHPELHESSPIFTSCLSKVRFIIRPLTGSRLPHDFSFYYVIWGHYARSCRSQWPRGLRRLSAAARLLGLWVRIPPGVWMSVSHGCWLLPATGLCDGLVTRPVESYRVWCVECDREASTMRRPRPTRGCCAIGRGRRRRRS